MYIAVDGWPPLDPRDNRSWNIWARDPSGSPCSQYKTRWRFCIYSYNIHSHVVALEPRIDKRVPWSFFCFGRKTITTFMPHNLRTTAVVLYSFTSLMTMLMKGAVIPFSLSCSWHNHLHISKEQVKIMKKSTCNTNPCLLALVMLSKANPSCFLYNCH